MNETGSSAGGQNVRPQSTIQTAIVPAAGFGTRLRPLTNAIPKEMLPVGGKLALERIVEELSGAGITDIIFILSPAKEARIRDYFGTGAEGVSFRYALQPEMRGLGDAVLQAEPLLEPGRPFLVALGDAVFEEPTPGGLSTQLCRAYTQADAAVGLLVQKVAREQISRYGVVQLLRGADITASSVPITDIVEKPAPEEAPSDLAAAARYLLRPTIFGVLRRTPPGKGGEIQLTDAMRQQLQEGLPGIAVPLQNNEIRHDIGSLETYYRAFAAFALKDVTNGPSLRAYLKTRLITNKESGRNE